MHDSNQSVDFDPRYPAKSDQKQRDFDKVSGFIEAIYALNEKFAESLGCDKETDNEKILEAIDLQSKVIADAKKDRDLAEKYARDAAELVSELTAQISTLRMQKTELESELIRRGRQERAILDKLQLMDLDQVIPHAELLWLDNAALKAQAVDITAEQSIRLQMFCATAQSQKTFAGDYVQQFYEWIMTGARHQQA